MTIEITVKMPDHQQAAIQAGAKALAEHQIGEDWGDDGVTFIGCDCGQWFGKRVNDGEELARTHEAQAALTAATPHLRAETVDRLKNFRNDYQYTYAIPGDPYAEGYLTACNAIIALLEGGGACCEHSKCPGGSICCCQEGGAE